MKQHITIEQLNELSPKGKESLKNWWWSKLDPTEKWCEEDAHKEIGSDIFPSISWVTIGQMIEFLDEHIENRYGDFDAIQVYRYKNGKQSWVVGYMGAEEIEEITSADNICDALWEAVKEIIDAKT